MKMKCKALNNPKFYWCFIDADAIFPSQGFVKWMIKHLNEIFTAMLSLKSLCIFQKPLFEKDMFFFKSKDMSDMNVFANKYLSYHIREVNWENIEHKSIDVQLFI